MRKVILSVNITLDGYVASPNGELKWHFQNWNDEMESLISEQIKDIDTILMGRVVYQVMAKHWPLVELDLTGRIKDLQFAEWINSTQKIVFTRTLSTPDWNNSKLVKENIREEINRLKQGKGKDMIMWGGVRIIRSFLEMDLFDEFRLWIAPVAIGQGLSWFGFEKVRKKIDLHLTSTTTFSNGVVLLNYSKREA